MKLSVRNISAMWNGRILRERHPEHVDTQQIALRFGFWWNATHWIYHHVCASSEFVFTSQWKSHRSIVFVVVLFSLSLPQSSEYISISWNVCACVAGEWQHYWHEQRNISMASNQSRTKTNRWYTCMLCVCVFFPVDSVGFCLIPPEAEKTRFIRQLIAKQFVKIHSSFQCV